MMVAFWSSNAGGCLVGAFTLVLLVNSLVVPWYARRKPRNSLSVDLGYAWQCFTAILYYRAPVPFVSISSCWVLSLSVEIWNPMYVDPAFGE